MRKRSLTAATIVVLLGLVLTALPGRARAQQARIDLDPPAEGEFILDKADLIDEADAESIRKISAALLKEKATPIIVVTIQSTANYVDMAMPIEPFAMMLFNQWGIGHAELNDQEWNTGILLLVSVGDRKARIELGAGWGREKDQQCTRIMDDLIIPEFKAGDYSAGILAGVQALDKMARDKPLPKPVRPWWHYALIAGGIVLAIFTVVSLIRRGSSGWAWLFWAVVLGIIGAMLWNMLRNSGRGGGGFGGGSFGGGFSGGGGATGSW
jgi:uncharacterized protein